MITEDQDGQADRASDRVRFRERTDATDDNPLGLQDVPAPAPPQLWRWLGVFSFVLLFLTIVATAVVVTMAKEKKTSLLQAESKRLEQSVSGRVKVLQTWLEARQSMGERLTASQVLRLFVGDLALHEQTLPLPRSLQDQRPYFHQLMTDFARQNNLLRATILRRDGVILLSSPGPSLAMPDLLLALQEQTADEVLALLPIRRLNDDSSLAVDVVIPFPKAQPEANSTSEPLAILVLTLSIERILKDVLTDKLDDPGREELALFQRRKAVTDRLRGTRDTIDLVKDVRGSDFKPGIPLAFARRNDRHPVYSFGEPVEGAPWLLYHAVDAGKVLSPLHSFIRVTAGFSALAVLTLTALFGAFWWHQGRNYHRCLADLYKAYAEKADLQRRFLASVTTAIDDWLMVTAPDGQIIYANPACIGATGSSISEMTAKRWHDLFVRPSTCEPSDDDIASLFDVDLFDIVEIAGRRRIVSERVSELCVDDGGELGEVRIFRDHTDLIAERRRRMKAVIQTVDAFIHAIEIRDPFLVGHTDRVRTHSLAIGRRLDLPGSELTSLALAASLSQIGKIFIPDDILAKPDRHNIEETAIMRDHILHAIELIRRVDFDLPIVDILAQMHERLDGSGYPHGLQGEDIGLNARILAVSDVFCARTAPRSYRDRLSSGKALYHLASNGQRYDVKVVAALADIIGRGARIDGGSTYDPALIDAAIWRHRHHDIDRALQPMGSSSSDGATGFEQRGTSDAIAKGIGTSTKAHESQ